VSCSISIPPLRDLERAFVTIFDRLPDHVIRRRGPLEQARRAAESRGYNLIETANGLRC